MVGAEAALPVLEEAAEPRARELEVRDGLEVAGEHRQAHVVALGQGLEHLGHAGRDVSAEVVFAHPRIGLHRRRTEVVAAVVEALARRRRPRGRADGRSRRRCVPPPRSAPRPAAPPRRRRRAPPPPPPARARGWPSATACRRCRRAGARADSAGRAPAPSLRALRSRAGQRPALLQAPEAPDRERHRPRRHEQADHDVAHGVEVDSGHPRPEAAVEAELVGRDRQQLDRSDEQRARPPRAP